MRCVLCNKESNTIYTTSKYGFICGKCVRRLQNTKEEKLRRHEKYLEMLKKYGC